MFLCTDKTAAQAMLADLLRTKDRAKAGLIDPRQKHLDRKAVEHLGEFLPVMRAKGKSEKDKDRKEAILRAFAFTPRSLSELTTKAVDDYLAGLIASGGTKKKHLSAISVWVTWLLKKDRIAVNPLDRIDIPATGKKTKERRALPVAHVQKLLDSCRKRPLAAFVERYGKKVRDEVRVKLEQRGRERGLVYKTAVYTGLRLVEIGSLRPCPPRSLSE